MSVVPADTKTGFGAQIEAVMTLDTTAVSSGRTVVPRAEDVTSGWNSLSDLRSSMSASHGDVLITPFRDDVEARE